MASLLERFIPGVVVLSVIALATTLVYFLQPPGADVLHGEIQYQERVWRSTWDCEINGIEELRKASIVYTWVNGSEPCYQQQRQKVTKKTGISSRNRESNELLYSIRSLLKFAPWMEGTIYIVSPGQVPNWVDFSHPRIKLVDQDDLIPDKNQLPNFNTNCIESFLWRIPGLTEIFIHMNDDYLFVKPFSPHRFFTCDGGMRFLAEPNVIQHKPANETKKIWLKSVRNTNTLLTEASGEQLRFFLKHAPFVYSRSSWARVHAKYGAHIHQTCQHKSRHGGDINPPLLHHYYMLEEGSELLGLPVEMSTIQESKEYVVYFVKDSNQEEIDAIYNRLLGGKGNEALIAFNDEFSSSEVGDKLKVFMSSFLGEPSPLELPEMKARNPPSIRGLPTCEIDPQLAHLVKSGKDSLSPPVGSFRRDGPRNEEMVVLPSPLLYSDLSTEFLAYLVKGLGVGTGCLFAVIVYCAFTSARGWKKSRARPQ